MTQRTALRKVADSDAPADAHRAAPVHRLRYADRLLRR